MSPKIKLFYKKKIECESFKKTERINSTTQTICLFFKENIFTVFIY